MRRTATRLGFTLIELTITLAIAAGLAATAIVSLNAVTDAHLKQTSVSLTGAMKLSYDRAAMLQRTQRLALDIDNDTWWFEYTTSPFALSSQKLEGKEGEHIDKEKKEDLDREEDDKLYYESLRSLFEDDDTSRVRDKLDEGVVHKFIPDTDIDDGTPTPLPSDVHFSRIWTGHQEEPFTSGIAYVHFFPGGYAEPAMIELIDDGEDMMSLKLSPLTGRVRTYDGPIETPEAQSEDPDDVGDL